MNMYNVNGKKINQKGTKTKIVSFFLIVLFYDFSHTFK